MNRNIRSPQAPSDILPVPLGARPLTDIGFPPSVAAALSAEGIDTVGTLLAAYPDEDFTSISGMGPGRQATATQLLRAYRE